MSVYKKIWIYLNLRCFSLKNLRQCGDKFFYSYKIALVAGVVLCFMADASAFSMLLGIYVFLLGWCLYICTLTWDAISLENEPDHADSHASIDIATEASETTSKTEDISSDRDGDDPLLHVVKRYSTKYFEYRRKVVVKENSFQESSPSAWEHEASIYRWLRAASESAKWLIIMGILISSGSVLAVILGCVFGYFWYVYGFEAKEIWRSHHYQNNAAYTEYVHSTPCWIPKILPSCAMLIHPGISRYAQVLRDIIPQCIIFVLYLIFLSIL